MPFYVTINNQIGEEIRVEVSLDVYNIFEEERKEIERLRKQQQRHQDNAEVESDLVAYYQALHTTSLEDTLVQKSEIARAMDIIKTCTETQQRRFGLNRILGYSLTDIAKMDNCSKVSVKESVDIVSRKLEKIKNSF